MQHRYHTLDVFTTTRFAGNPLAVFTDGDELSDDQMLAIAREMNLSETVFVQKPTDEEALARLRIFTTKEELKLAGHPVIGTWFLLAELGVVPAQEGGVHVLQQTGAGVLPVEIRFKDGRPHRVTMTQKEAAFKPAKLDKTKRIWLKTAPTATRIRRTSTRTSAICTRIARISGETAAAANKSSVQSRKGRRRDSCGRFSFCRQALLRR